MLSRRKLWHRSRARSARPPRRAGRSAPRQVRSKARSSARGSSRLPAPARMWSRSKRTDGLLLVDGGLASKSGELLDLLAAHGGAVRMLFNTSWRDEHTGSNETLGRGGAKIAAHVNTKLWLGGDFDVDWEDRHYAPRPAAALPGITFYTSGSLDFGGRKVGIPILPRRTRTATLRCSSRRERVAVGALLAVDRTRFPTMRPAAGLAGSKLRHARCSMRRMARPGSCRPSAQLAAAPSSKRS